MQIIKTSHKRIQICLCEQCKDIQYIFRKFHNDFFFF